MKDDLNRKKLTEDIKKLIPDASSVSVNIGKKEFLYLQM